MIRGQAVVMGVGSAGVVEAGDIGHQTLLELLNGSVAAPIQFFLLQILEKALHHRIVIGASLGRKGLNHPQLINHFAELPGGELAASIRMEHDAFGHAPQPDGIPERIDCQKPINLLANPAGNHLPCVQV